MQTTMSGGPFRPTISPSKLVLPMIYLARATEELSPDEAVIQANHIQY
jgi:hypothetical protein